MMSMAGDSSAGALPDPLSMVVHIISIEAGANSLGAETRLEAGSVNAEVMVDTSGAIVMVASEATGAATNSTALVSAVEV